jgi:hypothetical protein
MIERIVQWNRNNAPGDLISPFMRGKGERPLRLTFHIPSLNNATGETLDALIILGPRAQSDEMFNKFLYGAAQENLCSLTLGGRCGRSRFLRH